MKQLVIAILCLLFVNANEKYLIKYCNLFEVEIALAKAIYHAESLSGKLKADRYEKHLKTSSWYTNILNSRELTNNDSYKSIAPMHILFGTAKVMGFKGTPQQLKISENNFKYAIKYINRLTYRYYNIERVISAYNKGYPYRCDKTGIFENQNYVDRVLRYYKWYGGSIKID